MATDIPMPSYSDNMEEADLIGWLVAPGDFVHEGDPIAEIETDKATGELESPVSGTLVEICVPEGTTGVKVGSVVARIEATEVPSDEPASGEEITGTEAEPASASAQPEEAHPPSATPVDTPTTAPNPETATAPHSSAPVTALARRVAEQSGLDLAELRGTGSRGRITKADVDAAVSGTAPRRRMGVAALAVLDADCNVSKALGVCRQAAERGDEVEIDLLCFAVRAAALALRQVPELAGNPANAGAGFLVRVEAGDETPRTVREASRKSLAVLARELRDNPDKTTGEPDIEIFDFSGLGIQRVQTAATSGAAAALGMGAPHPTEAGLDPTRATFTLSVDTSRIELAVAARWFSEFCRRIEDPLEMLL